MERSSIIVRPIRTADKEDMKKIATLILAATASALAGCATLDKPAADSHRSAIDSVFAQRARLEKENLWSLGGERAAGLMAIDVRACPADFRSAWFDYLVEVQNLHKRVERIVGIASALGQPVSDLPSLIKFAATSPELGQYLLAALNKVDDAWGKVERASMNYGVMPRPGQP
jgi:hypothetical protein